MKNHRELRLTMTIGAVQAVVIDLMRRSETSDAFVEQLRGNRAVIIDLVMKLLR
jgi:hypothetical protein